MEVLRAVAKFFFDGQVWFSALIVVGGLAAIGIPLEIITRRRSERRYQAVLARMRALLGESTDRTQLGQWIVDEVWSAEHGQFARHEFVDHVHRALGDLRFIPARKSITVATTPAPKT